MFEMLDVYKSTKRPPEECPGFALLTLDRTKWYRTVQFA